MRLELQASGTNRLAMIAPRQDIEAIPGRKADIVTPDGVSPFLRERIHREVRAL
ncbi:MAG: hypothetical protein HY017_24515 [Betaproteobacteria bacterium]|nr:hypothetical protein [Betaproteobacteria bacterium]